MLSKKYSHTDKLLNSVEVAEQDSLQFEGGLNWDLDDPSLKEIELDETQEKMYRRFHEYLQS